MCNKKDKFNRPIIPLDLTVTLSVARTEIQIEDHVKL